MGERRERETADIAAFLRRMNRAMRDRVAEGDVLDLALFLEVQRDMDLRVGEAVAMMRGRYGWSWTQIGRAAGITKQAAWERWAHVERPRKGA